MLIDTRNTHPNTNYISLYLFYSILIVSLQILLSLKKIHLPVGLKFYMARITCIKLLHININGIASSYIVNTNIYVEI